MHMKACGNVFVCKCSIRLCSLGALKRHCKQFQHEPVSTEPMPEGNLGLSHPVASSAPMGSTPLGLVGSQPTATAQVLQATHVAVLPTSAHEAPAAQVSSQALPTSAFSSLVAADGGQHPTNTELLVQAASNGHYTTCEAASVLDSAARVLDSASIVSGFSGTAQQLGAQQLQSLAALGVAQQVEMTAAAAAAGSNQNAAPPASEWPPASAEYAGIPTEFQTE